MMGHAMHDVCVWHWEIVFYIRAYFYPPNSSFKILENMLRNLTTKIFIVTRYIWHQEPETKCTWRPNWKNAAEKQIILERTAATANCNPLQYYHHCHHWRPRGVDSFPLSFIPFDAPLIQKWAVVTSNEWRPLLGLANIGRREANTILGPHKSISANTDKY